MEFTGKVAVITGAASGIGRAVAVNLARRDVVAMALVDMGEAIEDVVAEVRSARISERQGRLIDGDETASMEKKKRDGYF